jgi:hypothetical protein
VRAKKRGVSHGRRPGSGGGVWLEEGAGEGGECTERVGRGVAKAGDEVRTGTPVGYRRYFVLLQGRLTGIRLVSACWGWETVGRTFCLPLSSVARSLLPSGDQSYLP